MVGWQIQRRDGTTWILIKGLAYHVYQQRALPFFVLGCLSCLSAESVAFFVLGCLSCLSAESVAFFVLGELRMFCNYCTILTIQVTIVFPEAVIVKYSIVR